MMLHKVYAIIPESEQQRGYSNTTNLSLSYYW